MANHKKPSYEDQLWAQATRPDAGSRSAFDFTPSERAAIDEKAAHIQSQIRASVEKAAPDVIRPHQRLSVGNLVSLAIALVPIVALLQWCHSPSQNNWTPKRIDRTTIGSAVLGCPTQRGAELLFEAAPQGDSAVAATSSVNGCVWMQPGTPVELVTVSGAFVLVRDQRSSRQYWVSDELAFR